MEVGQGPNWGCSAKEKKNCETSFESGTVHTIALITIPGKMGHQNETQFLSASN
jgi:hypothetical protein